VKPFGFACFFISATMEGQSDGKACSFCNVVIPRPEKCCMRFSKESHRNAKRKKEV
jgi:hypothetical protein